MVLGNVSRARNGVAHDDVRTRRSGTLEVNEDLLTVLCTRLATATGAELTFEGAESNVMRCKSCFFS